MSNDLFDRANYPDREPLKLIIGDRWAWKDTALGMTYPPVTYDLKYSLRLAGAGATEIEITAVADGSDFIIEVPAATTAGYAEGRYHYQKYIVRKSDSERITVGSGVITLVPNLDVSTDDPKLHVTAVLESVEAAIVALTSKRAKSWSITTATGSRTVTYQDLSELLQLRDKYRAELANLEIADRLAQGLGNPRRIKVRFGNA